MASQSFDALRTHPSALQEINPLWRITIPSPKPGQKSAASAQGDVESSTCYWWLWRSRDAERIFITFPAYQCLAKLSGRNREAMIGGWRKAGTRQTARRDEACVMIRTLWQAAGPSRTLHFSVVTRWGLVPCSRCWWQWQVMCKCVCQWLHRLYSSAKASGAALITQGLPLTILLPSPDGGGRFSNDPVKLTGCSERTGSMMMGDGLFWRQ